MGCVGNDYRYQSRTRLCGRRPQVFSQCSQLADVAALGAGLEKLQALTSLNLNVADCEQLNVDLQEFFETKAEFVAALGA